MAFLDSESRLHAQIEVSEASESREEWPPELRSAKKKTNWDPWAQVWSLRLIIVSVYTDRRQLFKGEIWSTFSSAKNNDQREVLCYFFWDSAARLKSPAEWCGSQAGALLPPKGCRDPYRPTAQGSGVELPQNDAWASWKQVRIRWTSKMFLLSGLGGWRKPIQTSSAKSSRWSALLTPSQNPW